MAEMILKGTDMNKDRALGIYQKTTGQAAVFGSDSLPKAGVRIHLGRRLSHLSTARPDVPFSKTGPLSPERCGAAVNCRRRRRGCEGRGKARHRRGVWDPRWAYICMVLLQFIGLVACSAPVSPPDATTPASPWGSNLPAAPADEASIRLKETMQSVMTAVASANPRPSQSVLRSQLISAGITDATLEVSASRTPTGLDVDAITAAARLGVDCVVGQIRESKITVVVLPVLASGRCIIGDLP